MDFTRAIKGKAFVIILVLASWLSYSFAVLHSHNLTKSTFQVEFNAIASAMSTVLFHLPHGSAYAEVITKVGEIKPTAKAVDYIRQNGVKSSDINDIANQPTGYALGFIYTIAMQLFGVSIYSIFWIFSVLLLISHLAFVFRFNDYRFVFSPLCLFSLTLMIFTPYVTNQTIADQVPIGGYRYFTLLAMLPSIHVALELFDAKKKLDYLSLTCLAIQVILIALCNLVAKSGSYALVNSILLVMICFHLFRTNKPVFKLLLIKLAYILSVFTAFCMIFYISIPSRYKEAGVATDVLWHRVWVGMAAHPEWPFVAVKNKFINCGIVNPDGTKGLYAGIVDSNSHCVWNEYLKTHPEAQINSTINYEKVLRKEFLRTAYHYPGKVFATLFYYKPKGTLITVMELLRYSNSTHKLSNMAAPFFSAIILMLSCLMFFRKITLRRATMLVSIMSTLTVSICSMYVVAWGWAIVEAELVFILQVLTLMSFMILINSRFMKECIKRQNLRILNE